MGLLPIAFTKMSGAGNTFVLVSTVGSPAWGDFERQIGLPRSEFAKMICASVSGIGADGFLLLEAGNKDVDYCWDFYNSDGSTAEMCGNAARCVGRYTYEVIEKKKRSNFKFQTGAGIVETMILGSGLIRVHMPSVRWVNPSLALETKSNRENFSYVNTGVPHLVQLLKNIEDATQMKDLAREVRHHIDLQPDGSNVTYYAVDAEQRIKAVTFERGVEDFTLACGTGAVAAALVHRGPQVDALNQNTQFEVSMPGGVLSVIFVAHEDRPFLEGEAVFLGDFQYSMEVFL